MSRSMRSLVRPTKQGGYGLDALWNDDFHHSAVVAMTGRNEAYYTDYHGSPQEFISAAKWGFLFQGQRYKWQKRAARHAQPRSRAGELRELPAKSRSDRQLAAGAGASTRSPAPASCAR